MSNCSSGLFFASRLLIEEVEYHLPTNLMLLAAASLLFLVNVTASSPLDDARRHVKEGKLIVKKVTTKLWCIRLDSLRKYTGDK